MSATGSDPFPIYVIHVLESSTQLPEQMGSKEKFWFFATATRRWFLFKYARENTGEDWSEKVACEIAGVLGLPHARVELAHYAGAPGVVVEDLRADPERLSLLHGNELLMEHDPEYPAMGGYRLSEHTLDRVAAAITHHGVALPAIAESMLPLPSGVDDALGLFAGYLLLDALIGNTDRHHENWAVVVSKSSAGNRHLELAATYDHASSLGRELSDTKRRGRLSGAGARGVEGYAAGTKSAFYRVAGDAKPMSPRDAFLAMNGHRPKACSGWLSRCQQVGVEALVSPLGRIPESGASDAARAFAEALIRYNYEALVESSKRRP